MSERPMFVVQVVVAAAAAAQQHHVPLWGYLPPKFRVVRLVVGLSM